jgi:peptidoglycan/LPS O-acetylase OafA/YrhL
VFYLVLPLLAYALVRSVRRGSITSAVAVLVVMVVANMGFLTFVRSSDAVDRALGTFWLPSYLSWFAAGMGLALARRASGAARVRRWLDAAAQAPLACWTIAAATLLLATTSVAGPRAFEAVPTAGQDITKNVLYLVVAVALMVPLAFGGASISRLRQHLSSRPWRFLGEISYGVFLWHLMVIQWIAHLRGDTVFRGDFVPMLVLTLAGTAGVATASLLLLERPLMRLRGRGPGRPRPDDGQAASRDGGSTATTASAAASPS